MCMTAMIALSAVQGVMAIQQANAAAARAREQAQQEYKAAAEETKAKYQEANRKIAEEQLDTLDEQSDRVRAANEALGTLRATETALSDSSLGTIFFENAYGDALNYTRIDENSKREQMAYESEKYGAEQSYINRTTLAQNNATNAIAESNARKTNAILGVASSGLKIYAQDQFNNTLLNNIKGTQQ
jgi:hypothetical protein